MTLFVAQISGHLQNQTLGEVIEAVGASDRFAVSGGTASGWDTSVRPEFEALDQADAESTAATLAAGIPGFRVDWVRPKA